jgi:hypothetical protein
VPDDYDVVPVEGNPFAPYINPQTGRPRITITKPSIDPVIMPGSQDVARLTPAPSLPALPTSPDQKVPQQDESFMDKYRREGMNVYQPVVPAMADPIRNAVFGTGEELMAPFSEGPSLETLGRSGWAAAGMLPLPGIAEAEAMEALPKASSVLSSKDVYSAEAIAAQARKDAVQNAIGRAKTASRGDQAPSPEGYYRTDLAGSGGLGGKVAYSPYPEVAQIWNAGRISAPDFVELAPEQSDVFKQAITDVKDAHRHGAAVTVYPDYSGMRTFLTPDKKAGFALNDGDIVSLFRDPNSTHDNFTVPALNLATSLGGNRLDAFDTQLPHLYAQSGFRAVSRIPFSDAAKPVGWNYNTFSHYNNGRPDVVFMVHDPEHATGYRPGDGIRVGPSEYTDEYTNAQAVQMQALRGIQQRSADIQRLRDTVPGFRDVMNYMLPDEIASVRGRGNQLVNNAQNLVDSFAAIPGGDEMAAAAYAGRAKRGWYLDSAKALVNIFGLQDSSRFAALLAAMSPQTSVENNAVNALNTWVNWNKAGRPTDPKAIIKVMGQSVQGTRGEKSVLGAWRNNAILALTHPSPADLDFDISGPKVDSFMNNLRGYVNEVTNDTWMANYANYPISSLQRITEQRLGTKGFGVKSPGYIAMSAAVRRAADVLTQRTGEVWTPAEVQETIWSWAKTLTEKSEAQGRSAENLLGSGDLTHDEINATPDFANLFVTNVDATHNYREILERGGYGDRLVASGRKATQATGTPFTAHGSNFSQDEFTGHLARAARRLDGVRRAGRESRGQYQYSPEDIAAAFVGGRSIGYARGGAAYSLFPVYGNPFRAQLPADQKQGFASGGTVKTKKPKTDLSIRYQYHPHGNQYCSRCSMFISPDRCTDVAGKISPSGWCRIFYAKGKTNDH